MTIENISLFFTQGNEVAVKDEVEREDKDDVSERGAETDEETNASDGEDQGEDRLESSGRHEEDEEQWKKYQEEAKKEQQLDTKVKESHPVHCPYYGEVSARIGVYVGGYSVPTMYRWVKVMEGEGGRESEGRSVDCANYEEVSILMGGIHKEILLSVVR